MLGQHQNHRLTRTSCRRGHVKKTSRYRPSGLGNRLSVCYLRPSATNLEQLEAAHCPVCGHCRLTSQATRKPLGGSGHSTMRARNRAEQAPKLYPRVCCGTSSGPDGRSEAKVLYMDRQAVMTLLMSSVGWSSVVRIFTPIDIRQTLNRCTTWELTYGRREHAARSPPLFSDRAADSTDLRERQACRRNWHIFSQVRMQNA